MHDGIATAENGDSYADVEQGLFQDFLAARFPVVGRA
jgi:hypothetical protein